MSPDLILPESVNLDVDVAAEVTDYVDGQPVEAAESSAETQGETGSNPGSEEAAVELPALLFATDNVQLTLVDPREHPGLETPVIQITLIGRTISVDEDTGDQVASPQVALVTQIDPALASNMGRDLASFGDKATAWARKGLIAATPAMAQQIAQQADNVTALRHARGGRRGR